MNCTLWSIMKCFQKTTFHDHLKIIWVQLQAREDVEVIKSRSPTRSIIPSFSVHKAHNVNEVLACSETDIMQSSRKFYSKFVYVVRASTLNSNLCFGLSLRRARRLTCMIYCFILDINVSIRSFRFVSLPEIKCCWAFWRLFRGSSTKR